MLGVNTENFRPNLVWLNEFTQASFLKFLTKHTQPKLVYSEDLFPQAVRKVEQNLEQEIGNAVIVSLRMIGMLMRLLISITMVWAFSWSDMIAYFQEHPTKNFNFLLGRHQISYF